MTTDIPSPHDPLNYVLTSTPGELKVSEPGAVFLSVTTHENNVHCKQIKLNLPYGTGWGDIFADQPRAQLTKAGNWKLSSNVLQNDSGSSIAITLSNGAPGYPVEPHKEIVLQVTGNINFQPGQVSVEVTDDAHVGKLPPDHKPVSLSIVKAPAQFYVDNLITSARQKPGVPRLEFESGKPIQFSWQGNATSYELFEGNSSKAIQVGNRTTYILKKGITRDTSFVLKAIHDTGGIHLTAYKTIALTVSNPDLDNVTIGGSAFRVETLTNFTKNLDVDGSMSVGKNMQVLGDTVFGEKSKSKDTDVKMYNTLDLQGQLDAKAAQISILGSVHSLFSAKKVHYKDKSTSWHNFKKTIKVNTDAYLTASVIHQKDHFRPQYNLQAFVEISVGENQYKTAAMARYDDNGNISWAVPGFLNLPVSANSTLTYHVILLADKGDLSGFFLTDLNLHPLGHYHSPHPTFEVLTSSEETAPFIPPEQSETSLKTQSEQKGWFARLFNLRGPG